MLFQGLQIHGLSIGITTKQTPKEKLIIYEGDHTWFKERCFIIKRLK